MFFFFFFILVLCFLIFVVTAQIVNPIAELVILLGIPSKEAKAKIEKKIVKVQAKISRCSI